MGIVRSIVLYGLFLWAKKIVIHDVNKDDKICGVFMIEFPSFMIVRRLRLSMVLWF